MKRRPLGVPALAAAIYFCVSGGPYGLEPLMQSGPGMAILLILVTPLVWALPAALMAAELTAAIPAEGGYYVWTKRALGPFWGFLCGWWTWLYSWVDVAIYPTLFAASINALVKLGGHGSLIESNPWVKWAVGMCIVVPMTYLNVRGVRPVGVTSMIFGFLLLAPFLVLVAMGGLAVPASIATPFTPSDQSIGQALNAGLFVVMWNYLGWDSMSTVAGEVDNPQKTFPRALMIGVPIVVLSYLLPTLVGLAAVPNYAEWEEGHWTVVGQAVGGPGLAYALTAAGVISAAGLFSATLLAASRLPFVLAEDRILPPGLTRLHPRFGTPYVAILVSSAVYSVLSFQSFEDLAVMDVILYSAAILLEFVALIVLRIKEPNLARPFRIPGGLVGVVLVSLLPAGVVAFGVVNQIAEGFGETQAEGLRVLELSAAALATGPAVWWIHRRRRRSLEGAP